MHKPSETGTNFSCPFSSATVEVLDYKRYAVQGIIRVMDVNYYVFFLIPRSPFRCTGEFHDVEANCVSGFLACLRSLAGAVFQQRPQAPDVLLQKTVDFYTGSPRNRPQAVGSALGAHLCRTIAFGIAIQIAKSCKRHGIIGKYFEWSIISTFNETKEGPGTTHRPAPGTCEGDNALTSVRCRAV